MGARFDAWDEQRDDAAWRRAFEEAGLDPGSYAYRERASEEVFPWDGISTGVRKVFLLKEHQRSRRGEALVDCREQCHACGVLVAYRESWSETWRCPPPGHKAPRLQSDHPVNGVFEPD